MIEPKYKTLTGLFADRIFRIPEYQRFYSWEKKQRDDLYSDLKRLVEAGVENHFMATIVCFKTPERKEVGAAEYGVYDIVDGQQRLTSLVLLLKAIYKVLPDDKDDKKDLGKVLVKADGNLLLLQTNNPNQRLFNDYLKDGKVPDAKDVETHADRNLRNAMRDSEKFVTEWVSKRDPLELLRIVRNRLGFVVYDTEQEAMVYTLFEVLNSRGLAVDWLDKCKTLLMGRTYALAANGAVRAAKLGDITARWGAIYKRLATRLVPGHEVIRIAVTLYIKAEASKPVSPDTAIEEISEYCTDIERPIAVTQWLYNIADKFVELAQRRYLEPVTGILHSRTLAVAIMLTGVLTPQEKEKALDQWERSSFRIFGLARKDARTKVGEFIRLARKILNGEEGASRYSEIMQHLRDLGTDYPIEAVIATGLENQDCYTGDPEDTRYILWRYEEHLAAKSNAEVNKELRAQIWDERSAAETIEHIFPQNPEGGGAWDGKLGTNEDLEANVHRIGNLLLLPHKLNDQASRKAFATKKEIYKKSEGLRTVKEVVDESDWTLAHIKDREARIVEWAKKAWGDRAD
jgi:Protein of unknown function DUF262/Protein of unknown function (DUF1524)